MATGSTEDTKVSVVGSRPATIDEAGYTDLTYTPVNNMADFPDFTPVDSRNTFGTITNGQLVSNGAENKAEFPLNLARDPDDAGQTIIRAARTAKTEMSFKVEVNTGETFYFSNRVLSAGVNIPADTLVQMPVNIAVTTDIVVVTA